MLRAQEILSARRQDFFFIVGALLPTMGVRKSLSPYFIWGKEYAH